MHLFTQPWWITRPRLISWCIYQRFQSQRYSPTFGQISAQEKLKFMGMRKFHLPDQIVHFDFFWASLSKISVNLWDVDLDQIFLSYSFVCVCVMKMCKIIDKYPPGAMKLSRAFAAASLYYNYSGTAKCFNLEDPQDSHGAQHGWDWQVSMKQIYSKSRLTFSGSFFLRLNEQSIQNISSN